MSRCRLLAPVVLLLLACCSCWTHRAHAAARRVPRKTAAEQQFASDQAELLKFVDRQAVITASRSSRTLATAGAAIKDVLSEPHPSINIRFRGSEYASFDRPLPSVIEKTLFKDFEEYFNHTQAFFAEKSNTYQGKGRQVVASVAGGRVSGVLGEVRDSQGWLLAEFSARPEFSTTLPSNQVSPAGPCKHFKRLATGIQKYGHMYHHFVLEVLPKIILLKPFLDSDTKVLLFGSAHEYKWLGQLGIPAEQVEVYDPSVEYCADELLVPSMSPIITPPKENFELLQAAFQADVSSLDDESSDFIIYCSRRDAHERIVSNEADLLAAIQKHYPSSELYVYTGEESVLQTIQLFRRASVVMGMHGAGLSHIVFAPRGATVVEFLFMPDPPMMFWHAASAMQQQYVMVPLAQSWWLQRTVTVPEQDVLDALALALAMPEGDCPLGRYKTASLAGCLACPAGTYRPAGASSCRACAPGRHSAEGAAFCSTCPAGAYSDEHGLACSPCPGDGHTLFPGASSADQCIPIKTVETQMRAMFNDEVLVDKLVSLPALDLVKPQTTVERITAAVSPHHWHEVHRMRQLKQQYLKELFNSEVQKHGLAADNTRRSQGRRRLTSGYSMARRTMLGYH